MKKGILPFLFFSFILFHQAQAQYCTPTINTSGVYFNAVHFNLPGFTSGITGGTEYSNASGTSLGYANNTGSSSGTIIRNCYVGIPYNIRNNAAGSVIINVKVFVDWNNDNDFDDAGEELYNYDNTITGITTLGTGTGWTTPVDAPSTLRVRFAVRQGGALASACGSYTGEVLDFKLTVATNTAPTINGSATAFMNLLKETQTNNEGATTQQLYNSSITGGSLTLDADACPPGGFAITSTSGSNGQWQFKVDAGAWTDFGAVSTSNALLLKANNTTRIRFVPTGPGTSGFDYRAWDGSSGANGQYANITSSGGTTAFSTGSSSLSLVTYSTAAVAGDVNVYMASSNNPNNIYNIHSSSLSRSTGLLKNPETITTDNVNGGAYDIAIDNTNNKLVWAGGSSYTDLFSSDLDGSNLQTLLTGVFSWPTGIAIGGNKIYIMDAGVGIHRTDLDGSNDGLISGGAGQAIDISGTGDIEYANNKIYYVNSPDYVAYNIMQANPDGTGTTLLYTTSSASIIGLHVTGSALYWTEYDGTSGSIKSQLLSGGSITTLLNESNMLYGDVFIDEANSKIYLSSYDANDYQNPKSRIKSIPLSGGPSTRLLELEDYVLGLAFNIGMGTLPVHFLDIKAYKHNNGTEVQWKIAEEENLSRYVIEKSADGRVFTDAGAVSASNKSSYTWPDAQPYSGKNYYRIKAINIDGSKQYSNTVLVNMDKIAPTVAIYPTIVSNQQFTLKLENVPAGAYRLTAINASGQQVYTQTLAHTGGSSVQGITIPNIPAGVYRLKIAGKTESWVETIVVK